MDAKRVIALVGGVLLVAGLLLGFMPVRAGGVDCGSAFAPSNQGLAEDYFEALSGLPDSDHNGDCKDATSGRMTVSLVLAIPGALLLIAGAGSELYARTEKREPETDVTPAEGPQRTNRA